MIIGKTTLLKCLLGRLAPTSGSVLVFNEVPGSIHSSVPGLGVGYMPQEIALYEEFNIHEHFIFYSKLFHMDSNKAKERENELIELLDLPRHSKQKCKSMSGGQQR